MGNAIKKIASLLTYPLLFWKRSRLNRLMVLTYHRIADEPNPEDSLIVSLRNFEHQIVFLKRHYNLISGEELAEIITSGASFPQESCLITFDDGWRDNYTHAFPLLKKHGVPAVIFISTDYIGTDQTLWHERLLKLLTKIPSHTSIIEITDALNKWPEGVAKKIIGILKLSNERRRSAINNLIEDLKRFDLEQINEINHGLEFLSGSKGSNEFPSMLSWQEVSEMSKNNIYFGSHTKSHPILTQINDHQIRAELIESKKIIEDRLRKPVHFLCYPNGNYNEKVLKVMKEAGYLAGFSCIPGTNDSYERPFELKRRHIIEDFSLNLEGQFSELFFKVELSGIRLSLAGWISKKDCSSQTEVG